MTVIIKRSSDKAIIEKQLETLPRTSKFDAYLFCGVIQLSQSPIDIQKSMRDEWE